MITFETVVFYFFALIAVSVSVGVIASRNPVYSALFLVLAFVASAGLWLLLYAEFLAIVLVLVYVGAVMVLFLFVLMMLDVNFDNIREGFWRYLPLALVVVGFFVWEVVQIISNAEFAEPTASGLAEADNTRALGGVLYTEYVYPFELAAVLLLVAIIAAVALTLRQKRSAQSISVEAQVNAPKQVRLVSLGSGAQAQAQSQSAQSSQPTPQKEIDTSQKGEQ